MTNRLETLPSGWKFEWMGNNPNTELRVHLEAIKKVLKDKPNKEEVNSAKIFLDSLVGLKTAFEKSKSQTADETRNELSNLSWELAIYQETQALIEWLKTPEKWVEVDSGKVEFEWLFRETKNKMVTEIKDVISVEIDKRAIFKRLDNKQRDNIKIWIVARLVNSWLAESLVWGFSGKIKSYDKALSWSNPMEMMSWLFDKDKEEIKKEEKKWDDNIKDKLKSQIESEIKKVEDFVNINEKNPKINEFLNNSLNIEIFKEGDLLDNFEFVSPKNEKEAFELLKSKIEGYDSKLMLAEKTKDHIFDQVSNMPSFISNALISFISMICSWGFIGDLIKKFLWLESSDEKSIETELKWELEARKSIKVLKSFWLQKWPNGENIETKNSPNIAILKDKDLSNLDIKELKPFLIKAKTNWANIASANFWYSIFEKNTIDLTNKTQDDKESTTSINIDIQSRIDQKDFEGDNTPSKNFYSKLNWISFEQNVLTSPATIGKPMNEQTNQWTVISEANKGLLLKYKDLTDWIIINGSVVAKFNKIRLSDFTSNWTEEDFIKNIKESVWDIDQKILWVTVLYWQLINKLSGEWKIDSFKTICLQDKKDTAHKDEITFLDISYNRWRLVKEITWVDPTANIWNTVVATTNKEDAWKGKEGKKEEVAQDNWLPKTFTYDKNDSTVLVDNRKYKVDIFGVDIKNIEYKDWIINLSWGTPIRDWKRPFNKEEVKKLYSEIKNLKIWEEHKVGTPPEVLSLKALA